MIRRTAKAGRGIAPEPNGGCIVGWEEILAAAAETQADLIVMGTHGRRGFVHALLGRVAERVVRMSPVPVLTVRSPSNRPGG